MSLRRLSIVLPLIVALAGCALLKRDNSCTKPGGYETAQNLPPLKVPAGMDAPDTRASMPIPDLPAPEKPREAGDPCLDEPPPYDPRQPVSPAAKPPAK